MKKEAGITLIALIVTVIILLILAGVAISLVIGDNGLLNKATTAGEKYTIESIREKVEMGISDVYADAIINHKEVTMESMLDSLLEKKIFDEIDKEGNCGFTQGYIVTLRKDGNGTIVIESIVKDTGVRMSYTIEPTDYTNGNVKVKLKMWGPGKIKNVIASEGMTKQADGSYEVIKNGKYTLQVELENAQKIEKEIIIDNIDKIAPKDFTIQATNLSGQGFAITGETQDADATQDNTSSGINKYEFYVNNNKYETREIRGLSVGNYSVYAIVYDKAGNQNKTNTITVQVTRVLTQITVHNERYLAIDDQQNLWTWGRNNIGQLGTGDKTDKLKLTPVKAGTKFKTINSTAGRGYSSIAIDVAGNLWGWGQNASGELGIGNKTSK